VLLVYRLGHLLWVGETPLPIRKVLWPTYRLIDLVWCKLLAGVELDHRACIGPGLRLPHGGRGVVVGLGVTIGADVAIYQYASVGAAEIGRGAWPLPVPIIEDEVRIATGARVLGAIRVGRQALIGANAVVVKDVPPGRTAATDPARIVF
jgi:serine O-acetyltransferase